MDPNYGYCRHLEVDVVKDSIRRMHRGRDTWPDEILILKSAQERRIWNGLLDCLTLFLG